MTNPNFHEAIREFARTKRKKNWYLKFCKMWDNNNVNTVQKWLRTKKSIFNKLIYLSSNYKKKKSGNPFSRDELYALREPDLPNKCICGNPLPYDSITRTWRTGCSRSCAAKTCVPKRELTCQKKYGSRNPSMVEKFKEKRTKTIRKIFGVDNAFQSEIVKKKIKKTNIKNLGVENPSQSMEVQKRKEATSVKTCGKKHWTKTKEARKEFSKNNPMHNEKAKNKMQKTNLKKYGCISSFGNKKVQKKIRNTNVEKYGVENPGAIGFFKTKRCKDKNGITHKVQGYEPIIIDWLSQHSIVLNLYTKCRNKPVIKYKFNGKEHKYYPDILAVTKKGKRLIEVKGSWTLKIELDIVIAKSIAANEYMKKEGGEFWFFYITDGGVIHKLKFPSAKELKHLLTFK
jgi:hypothetical protein